MSLRASQLLPMSSVPQLQDACLQIGLQKLNGQCQDVPNDENWHQPPDAYHPLFTLRQSNMAGKSPRRILCIHTHDLSRDFKHFPPLPTIGWSSVDHRIKNIVGCWSHRSALSHRSGQNSWPRHKCRRERGNPDPSGFIIQIDESHFN